MPLQRSTDGNQSDMNVFSKEFCIEPEYLETDEIKHELRSRNIDAGGDRRSVAGRLRSCISEEKRNPGAYAMYSIGVPRDEFDYCTRGTDRLKSLLNQVSLDPVTHDRFMSVFLHLEARLNRIPKLSNALDLSEVMFNRNEEYSEIHSDRVMIA